jgi:hypothetical protein
MPADRVQTGQRILELDQRAVRHSGGCIANPDLINTR